MTARRDTQFSKFADGVVQELMSVHDGAMQASEWWQEQARNIIAKRAYDLVEHAFNAAELPSAAYDLVRSYYTGDISSFRIADYFKPADLVAETPDMPELPEVSEPTAMPTPPTIRFESGGKIYEERL